MRGNLSIAKVTVAAADLADEIGFDKITISALARQFGVAVPSMYTHVRNLDDLRVKVAMLATAELADIISEAATGRSNRAAMAAFASVYRGFARLHPGRYDASHIQLNEQQLAESPGHQRVFRVVNQVFQDYGLAGADLIDAVRFVRSTIHGFVSLEAHGGFGNPHAVEQSWQRALEALHLVLANWSSVAGESAAAADDGRNLDEPSELAPVQS
jgi:AcrR family transcriptional regulator